jgi:hypothetical protein
MTAEHVEQEWMRGYNAARALCLRHGVEPGLPEGASAAWESGFSWAVFDWLDANGLHGGAGAQRGA